MNTFIESIYKIGRLLIIGYMYLKRQFFRYYLSKILFRLKLKNRYIIREIHGSKMYLDFQEKGISRDLLKNENREILSVETIQQELKPGDIVIDIGANIGYYALLEARLVGDEGRVYAIEPVAQNVELLKKNIELNNYKNVEVFQLAMGNENKTAPIYLSDKCNCSTFIKPKTFVEEVPIKMVTLDKFLENKPYPTLIRMDVEGYEVEIVEGMKKILSLNKPLKLLIEVHGIRLSKGKEMLRTFEKFGLKIKKVINNPKSHQLLVQDEPKFIKKTFNFLNSKLGFHRPGYLNFNNIDGLIHSFLTEKIRRWDHVFLERK